jgi:hypothetical protein
MLSMYLGTCSRESESWLTATYLKFVTPEVCVPTLRLSFRCAAFGARNLLFSVDVSSPVPALRKQERREGRGRQRRKAMLAGEDDCEPAEKSG